MEQNFDVFDFSLTDAEMETTRSLNTHKSSFFDHRDSAVIESLANLVRNV